MNIKEPAEQKTSDEKIEKGEQNLDDVLDDNIEVKSRQEDDI